jgi:WD40 repeat protein
VEWDLADETGTGKAVAGVGSIVYAGCYLLVRHEIAIGTKAGDLIAINLDDKVKTVHKKTIDPIFAMVRNYDVITASEGGIWKWLHEGTHFFCGRFMKPLPGNVRALALSPDLEWIATGWNDGRIRVIRNLLAKIVPGDLPPPFEVSVDFVAHEPSVFAVKYSANGKYLLSGGRDAQIKVWSASDYALLKTIPAHWFTVNDLAFSPDGKLFASASRDKSIKIWDAETFDLLKVIDLKNFPQAHTYSVNRLFWTSYENYLVTAGDDRVIKVWKITAE